MPRFKGLLFDLGNTLLRFEGKWPEVFAQADAELLKHLHTAGLALDGPSFMLEFRTRLKAYSIQRESDFIEHTTANILRSLLAELGYSETPDELIRPALKRMYSISQSHWHPEADAKLALEALKQRGYRLGIISNASDDRDVQSLVDKAELRPYVDFILSSAACGIRKPNPKIFHLGLAHWDFPPQETAMIGDTLGADILGADNAGIFSIWITRRADTPSNRDHADTILPNAKIETLAELPALLEKLENSNLP